MGEKRSFRDRLFPKRNKNGEVGPAQLSSAPNLLSSNVTTNARSSDSNISLAEPSNASNRLIIDQIAANYNDVAAETTEEVVSFHSGSGVDSAAPDNNSQLGALGELPEASLWDDAYDALKASQGKLIDTYEDLLSKALHTIDAEEVGNLIPQHDARARRQKMDAITALGLQHMEDNKISADIFGHEVTIEDAIAKTASAVSWAEAYIKDAVKDLPYASIVVAGVSLVLPLLKNPVVVEAARNTGFTYVTSQMRYYAAMEPLLVPNSMDPDLKADLTIRLSQLYESIIEFQVRSVIYLYRSKAKNLFRGTINYDDWTSRLKSIKEAEKELEAKFSNAQSAEALGILRQIGSQAEELHKQLNDALNQVVQLLRDQLSVASRMDRRMADAEDRSCIESLRADDPRYDKARIEMEKGGLVEDSYRWIFAN